MKRGGVVGAALALILLAGTPVRAGGVWDPNEPIHRLDMRWVGAYEQADGRLRVTVTFYDRVRLRWFSPPQFGGLSTMVVAFKHDRDTQPLIFAMVARRGGSSRLIAAMCESSGCSGGRVTRPNAFTIRAWFRPFDPSPRAGWFFYGRSARDTNDRLPLDRTAWGTVT